MEVDKFPVAFTLAGISVVEDEDFVSDELCLESVQLFFRDTDTVITLRPVADTDEIEMSQQLKKTSGAIYTPEWCRDLVGQKLQTIWICTNSQGYQDQIVFAFEFLHPSIGFISEGSVLKVFRHRQIMRDGILHSSLMSLITNEEI